MPLKIAAISDIHLAATDAEPTRRCHLADLLLQRAVNRVNTVIRPDLTLLLGDIIESGRAPEADAQWARLREILDGLASPWLALPGNHDADPAAFYRHFPDPGDVCEVAGARFLRFLDPEAPGWNAVRTEAGLEQMAAGRNHDGPVIMLQHCSLFPPETSDCPFHYTNAADIVARMPGSGITLAISGHYHAGVDLIRHPAGSFIITPALCEPPFSFLEIDLDGDRVAVTRHTMALPSYSLVDTHVHTPFAYCSEDMSFERALDLGAEMGLAGLAFTEHTGQLYFDKPTFRAGRFLPAGIDSTEGWDDRLPAWLAAAGRHHPPAALGLEVDTDFQGRPVLRPADRERVGFILGSIHALPEARRPQPDPERLADEWLSALARVVEWRPLALAHPFRVYRWAKLPVPERLFDPAVRLLRDSGVAAEVNFHKQQPERELIRRCLQAGVKLTLASDAHQLWEVGELTPHLRLLAELGYPGDPTPLLAKP